MKKIWEYTKKIILNILAFLKSLFIIEKKDIKKTNITTIKEKSNTKNFTTSDNTTLPDEDNIKTSNDTIDNKNKSLKLQKDNNKKTKKIIKEELTLDSEEFISLVLDEVLEKEHKIDVKKVNRIIEKKIEELKKEIIPKIQEKIHKKEITNKEELTGDIKKTLKERFIEKPLLEPKKITAKEYVLAVNTTPVIKPKKRPKIKKDKIIKIDNDKVDKIKDKIDNSPITMVPTEKEVSITPKDHLITGLNTTAVIAASIAKEILSPPKKIDKKEEIINDMVSLKKEEIKEDKPKNIINELSNDLEEIEIIEKTKNIKEEILKEQEELLKELENIEKKESNKTENTIEKTKLTNPLIIENIEEQKILKDNQKTNKEKIIEKNKIERETNEISQDKKDIQKTSIEEVLLEQTIETMLNKDKQEEIPKEKIKEEITINEETPEENIKEDITKKEETKKNDKNSISINNINNKIKTTIYNANNEMNSNKEIEDKEYEYYNKKIDQLLLEIEEYIIKYENVLSKEQIKILKNEQNLLEMQKNRIYNQKLQDIKLEESILKQTITKEEIEALQMHLEKLHIQNKIDINEELINKLEDLENVSKDKVEKIEKSLIKKKIRKAAILTELGALISLPFIRNKYFIMFSAGLFIKTHLVFLTDIFRRKTSPLIPADIESLKNGQSALNAALNTTYENILQLEQLEQMIFTKYPELINDKSFTKNLSTLKNRLNKNYNKLIKKQETIEKYIKKTNKHIKILKKEKKKDDK